MNMIQEIQKSEVGNGPENLRRSPRLAAKTSLINAVASSSSSMVNAGTRSSPRLMERSSSSSNTKCNVSVEAGGPENIEVGSVFIQQQRETQQKSSPRLGETHVFDTSLSPILPPNHVSPMAYSEDASVTSVVKPEPGTMDQKKRKKRKHRLSMDEENEISFFDTLRKRKRRNTEEDGDNISIKSFSLRSSFRRRRESTVDLDTLSVQSFSMGTGYKRNRSLVKVSSFANLLSPVSSVKKVGQALQRSMSIKSGQAGCMTIKPYCKPQATPTKRRDSKLWSETVQGSINGALTKIEIKRQEAIYELYQGEVDLVEDLKLVMKAYRDSMRSLRMLTEEELNIIFGSLDDLRPLHEELIIQLGKQRGKNGMTEEVGKVLLKWLPTLTDVYVNYCTNQLAAKPLLDAKKQDSKVNDFLERCIESPFSRKLDLWNFLDVPRSRLVKYPLLLKNILRLTPSDHVDKILIADAIKACEDILSEVDRRTGETKCKHYINLFEYLDDRQRNPLIAFQKVLLCGGVLKNSKGTKYHVFLFEDILVVTRLTTRNNRECYQVYRQPIPVRTMALDDIPDGEIKRSGSFRGALSHGPSVKCGFKVRSTNPSLSQSFTLHTTDEHDKKQWLQLFRTAIRRARQDDTCV